VSKHTHPEHDWLTWRGDQMRCERCGSIDTDWSYGRYYPKQVRARERATEAFIERHSRCEVVTT